MDALDSHPLVLGTEGVLESAAEDGAWIPDSVLLAQRQKSALGRRAQQLVSFEVGVIAQTTSLWKRNRYDYKKIHRRKFQRR